jgi:glycosyltransferase involved in cell wall biosynthesis
MLFPLVSVLIPSYNHSKYVIETLNSILEDTYPNKEIIIIDDGSKDNSVDIIQKWVDLNQNNLHIFFKQRKNYGICYTLNELINNAKGKYIIPLASDDFLINNTIEERVQILEKEEKNGKFVLVSDAQVIDEKSNFLMESSIVDYNKGVKDDLFNDNKLIEATFLRPCFSGATVLINKKVYDYIGLYPMDLKAEDWFFYQRVACLKMMSFYDKIVSKYRVHDNNTSGLHISDLHKSKMYRAILSTYFKNFSLLADYSIKIKVIYRSFKLFLRLIKHKYL